MKKLYNGMKVLITGGAGFIGGSVVRRLLQKTNVKIYNLDKYGYASDLSWLNAFQPGDRHVFLKVDLTNKEQTIEAIKEADPDLVMHLAAESHVDRSIDGPETFIQSNVIGTFNLLQALLGHWQDLSEERQNQFRIHHISTDEVFGSLGDHGYFSEKTPYSPRSPYSASKASSDHIMKAWYYTYGLPIVLTNCSNNFGPWQFPEKLIPLVILKAINGESIPIYGNGSNIRDWLYIEDHLDALLLVATSGEIGKCYCIGGQGEKTNLEVVHTICKLLEERKKSNYSDLITFVQDRPGHDHRYAIDSSLIKKELNWMPKFNFEQGLSITIDWYLNNLNWCEEIKKRSPTYGDRIGLNC